MSGTDSGATEARSARPTLGRGLTLAIAAAALIGAAAVLYVMFGSAIKPGDPLRALATGPMAKLKLPDKPASAPATGFTGPDGAPAHLADFRGKVTLVNFWATWCAPCVKEMPTLAKLQAAYAGKPVQVVALSQDRAEDAEKAKAFLAKYPPLAFYQDAKFAVMPATGLPAQGFPTTVIYDRSGQARAYLAGEADWSSPEAKALVDKLSEEPTARDR